MAGIRIRPVATSFLLAGGAMGLFLLTILLHKISARAVVIFPMIEEYDIYYLMELNSALPQSLVAPTRLLLREKCQPGSDAGSVSQNPPQSHALGKRLGAIDRRPLLGAPPAPAGTGRTGGRALRGPLGAGTRPGPAGVYPGRFSDAPAKRNGKFRPDDGRDLAVAELLMPAVMEKITKAAQNVRIDRGWPMAGGAGRSQRRVRPTPWDLRDSLSAICLQRISPPASLTRQRRVWRLRPRTSHRQAAEEAPPAS